MTDAEPAKTVLPDQGCTAENPFMCGDGKCIKNMKDCTVILQKCNDPSKSFSCLNGDCVQNQNVCLKLINKYNEDNANASKHKEDSEITKIKIAPCTDPTK